MASFDPFGIDTTARQRASRALLVMAAATALPGLLTLATYGWTTLGVDALIEVATRRAWAGVGAQVLWASGALALAWALGGGLRWAAAAVGALGLALALETGAAAWWISVGLTDDTPPVWLLTLLGRPTVIAGYAVHGLWVAVLATLAVRWRSPWGLGAAGLALLSGATLGVVGDGLTLEVGEAATWAVITLLAVAQLLVGLAADPVPPARPLREVDRADWARFAAGLTLHRRGLSVRLVAVVGGGLSLAMLAFAHRSAQAGTVARLLPLADLLLGLVALAGLWGMRTAPAQSGARGPLTAAAVMMTAALAASAWVTASLHIALDQRVPSLAELERLQRFAFAIQALSVPTVALVLLGVARLAQLAESRVLARRATWLARMVWPLMAASLLPWAAVQDALGLPIWIATTVGAAIWAGALALGYLHLLRRMEQAVRASAGL